MSLLNDFNQNIFNYSNRNIKPIVVDEFELIGLSTRVKNALRRNGINTLKELVDTPLTEIAIFRNVGYNSILQIIDKVQRYLEQQEGIK